MDSLTSVDLGCDRAGPGGIVRVYFSQRRRFGRTWYYTRTTAPYQYGLVSGHSGAQNVWFAAGTINPFASTLTSSERRDGSRLYDIVLQCRVNKWDILARDFFEQAYASGDICAIAEDNIGQFWLIGEYHGCQADYSTQTGDRSSDSTALLTLRCTQRTPLRQVTQAYANDNVLMQKDCLCDLDIAAFCGLDIDDFCALTLTCGPTSLPAFVFPTPVQAFTFDNAWDFDGVNDYVIVPGAGLSGMFGTGDFAASVWVKLDSVGGWIMENYGSDTRGFNISANGGSLGGVYYGASGSLNVRNTVAYNLGVWYHIVMQRNGNIWECWIDGALVNSGNIAALGGNATTDDLYLVSRNFFGSPGAYLDGQLDEATLYDRALTPAEIAFLYNSGNGNAPSAAMLPNLVARWTFDTAAGTLPNPILADVSGNGNTGTGQNFLVSPLVPH